MQVSNRTLLSFDHVDLLSKNQIEYIIHEFQPNYILHLASYSSVAYSWKEPVQSFQNNTNIFLNLIDAVRKSSINTRILSIGSSEEYGNVSDEDLPLKEDHRLNPLSPLCRCAYVTRILIRRLYKRLWDGSCFDKIIQSYRTPAE